jgi:hypothetical protein
MTEDEKLVVDPNAIVRSITVQIAAPAQVVWDVLVDLAATASGIPFALRLRACSKWVRHCR